MKNILNKDNQLIAYYKMHKFKNYDFWKNLKNDTSIILIILFDNVVYKIKKSTNT